MNLGQLPASYQFLDGFFYASHPSWTLCLVSLESACFVLKSPLTYFSSFSLSFTSSFSSSSIGSFFPPPPCVCILHLSICIPPLHCLRLIRFTDVLDTRIDSCWPRLRRGGPLLQTPPSRHGKASPLVPLSS